MAKNRSSSKGIIRAAKGLKSGSLVVFRLHNVAEAKFATIHFGDGDGNSILWPDGVEKHFVRGAFDAVRAQQIAEIICRMAGFAGSTEVVRADDRIIQVRILI
ncbi:MAG: hypothetical protein AAB730_01855 [Patescibacteria group bacterium]